MDTFCLKPRIIFQSNILYKQSFLESMFLQNSLLILFIVFFYSLLYTDTLLMCIDNDLKILTLKFHF